MVMVATVRADPVPSPHRRRTGLPGRPVRSGQRTTRQRDGEVHDTCREQLGAGDCVVGVDPGDDTGRTGPTSAHPARGGTIGGMELDDQTAAFTVDDAIALAARAHRGQRDAGNPALPYVTHPIRVMAAFSDPDRQMVAVLHDVVEDTPVTIEDLRAAGVTEDRLDAIDALTKRPGEQLETYWDRVRANLIALDVKLADIGDNSDPERLAVLAVTDPARAERLRAKYARARSYLER